MSHYRRIYHLNLKVSHQTEFRITLIASFSISTSTSIERKLLLHMKDNFGHFWRDKNSKKMFRRNERLIKKRKSGRLHCYKCPLLQFPLFSLSLSLSLTHTHSTYSNLLFHLLIHMSLSLSFCTEYLQYIHIISIYC